MQTTLSSKGQVVLPGQIRRKLGLRSGDHLEIRVKNGEIVLTPSKPIHKPKASIVVDPDTPWVLDPFDLKSQCKNTPFDESKFSGRVARTIVGGRTVYEHV